MNKQKPSPSKQQQNKHNVKFEWQLKGQNHYGKWLHISMKITAFMWPLCVIPFLWAAAHGPPPLRAANERLLVLHMANMDMAAPMWSNLKWIQAHECYQYVCFLGNGPLTLAFLASCYNAISMEHNHKSTILRDEWKPNSLTRLQGQQFVSSVLWCGCFVIANMNNSAGDTVWSWQDMLG